jgi:hypothetical protein
MLEQEIHMKDGIWTILKKGDEICIVDSQGRCRHQSKGHVNTAMHLAMRLADNELPSESNMDEALRMTVERFKNEQSSDASGS